MNENLKIRRLKGEDVSDVLCIINEAARAYKKVLPSNVYRETQMTLQEFLEEARRIKFYLVEDEGNIIGIMGYEYVKDVALIRHAYIKLEYQRRGVGSRLLQHLEALIESENKTGRLIVGTYTNAYWAVNFYRKHGYDPVSNHDATLRKYYFIPDVQRENSTALEKRIR